MLLNRKNGSFSAQAAETVVIKKPSAELSENTLKKIWVPPRIKLPVKRACFPRREQTRFRRTCCFQKMGLTAIHLSLLDRMQAWNQAKALHP